MNSINKKKKIIRVVTIAGSFPLIDKQMSYMSQWYDVIGISSPHPNFDQIIHDQGASRGYQIKMTRRITPIKDLLALLKMIFVFLKERPYIVHTHTPKAGFIGMIAAFLSFVPHRLHTVAGMPVLIKTGFLRKLLLIIEKLTYLCATRVYPNSIKLADIIVDLNLADKKKVRVIGQGSSNGIDTSVFDPSLFNEVFKIEKRAEIGFNQNDFVFIFLGRIVKDKGVTELIEAFKAVNLKYPIAKLLILGHFDRNLNPLSAEIIHEIRSHSAIFFADWQEDVRPWLYISDVLAFPSYREGFPKAVLQAGSMGLPSIVTNINGCNEIVIDQKNGIIISPYSSIELASAMQLLINDKLLFKTLKSNSRSMIKSRYEQSEIWSLLKNEYTKLENNT